MTAKTQSESIKSARKKFMIMRVRTSVMQILNTPDEDVDAELEKLLKPLVKIFGAKEGEEILLEAIAEAGENFQRIMDTAMAEIMADNRENDK